MSGLPQLLNKMVGSFRRFTSFLSIAVLTLGLVTAIHLVQQSQDFREKAEAKTGTPTPVDAYKPREVIIKFNNAKDKIKISKEAKARGVSIDDQGVGPNELETDTLPASILDLHNQLKIKKISKLFKDKKNNTKNKKVDTSDLENIFLLEVEKDVTVDQIIRYLENDRDVKWVQPNYEMSINFTPDDPYFHSSGAWGQNYKDLWGLQEDRMSMENAWDINQGLGSDNQPVIVAVVDTGLDTTHEDISSNIWINTDEIPNNNIDDDLNGYVDDINGWNFFAGNSNIIDDNDHGSHVAGTIAAEANGLGIIGVAPKIHIMPIKSLNHNGGGYSSDLAAGIVYAVENGAAVINNSWGCPYGCPENPLAEEAIAVAYDAGVVVVMAAGNSSRSVQHFSPQNMTHHKPIVVSASDYQNNKAVFTNVGYQIDVAAPGVDILSINSKSGSMCDAQHTIATKYCFESGTSMSAPHVSGVAALVKALYPEYSNEDVRHVINSGASDIGSASFDAEFGWGLVNADATLRLPIPPQLNISSPQLYQVINTQTNTEPIEIIGTAKGISFKEYQLLYSTGSEPLFWNEITQRIPTPVDDQLLGELDVKDIPSGRVVIRLDAYTEEGVRFSEITTIVLTLDVTRLSFPHQQSQPNIEGKWMIWTDFRLSTIYKQYRVAWLYNRETKQELQLHGTTYSSYMSFPDIDNNRAFWNVEYSTTNFTNPKVMFLRDLATWRIREIVASYQVYYPVISGNYIAYIAKVPGNLNYNIFLYNLNDDSTKIVTTTAQKLPESLEISGNIIVWEDYRSSETEADIYGYNIDEEREFPISLQPFHEFHPTVEDNKVAWIGSRDAEAANIFLFDLITQERSEISYNKNKKREVDIEGSRLAWREVIMSVHQIITYDSVTGEFNNITENPYKRHYRPKLYLNTLVWYGYGSEGLFDIYTVELPPLPTPTPTPTLIPITETITLEPEADSYVDEKKASNNYGDRVNLKVGQTPSAIAYLKFNLSDLAGYDITSAKLRLFVADESSQPIYINNIIDNSWTENDINFVNRPPPEDSVVSFGAPDVESFVEVDLTDFISSRHGEIVSFAIQTTGTSKDDFKFKSKELSDKSKRPILIIN